MWTTVATVSMSLVALIISAVTLWRSHLAPPRVVAALGPMHMRIHTMQSDKGSWLLPHFAASVSFTNAGSRIGRIEGVRAAVRYVSLPIPGAFEVFRCHGEYSAGEYWKHSGRRFGMIENALLGDFVPLVLLPKTTTTRFYVFSARWDKPVRQEAIEIAVEIVTDRVNEWTPIGEWRYEFPKGMWDDIESGDGYTVYPRSGAEDTSAGRYPSDLHKYTLDEGMRIDQRQPVGPTTEITGRGRKSSHLTESGEDEHD